MDNKISIIPLGGIGDITKNMYLYEYGNQILIVDCGLGFADETMLGVDLLLPDISYLLQTCLPAGKAKKKIVGMLLSHGHEDHMGALPFVLPQLIFSQSEQFPIYGSPFTAALANEKLREFGIGLRVKTVPFGQGAIQLHPFSATFLRVTHSVPDTAHIFIQTPIGNFYHGSDFKFDDSPVDGKQSEYERIQKLGSLGVLCLLSDCLGVEREGRTASEKELIHSFAREIEDCRGKFIVTTYSSNIARLNQVIEASEKAKRKVVFIGRSLIKAKNTAKLLNYLIIQQATEIESDQIKNYKDEQLTLIVAGSQGQEESAMAKIANGEHREVKLNSDDTVVFSADPIPGNEVLVYELVDTIAKKGTKVLYSAVSRKFHVSGHGASEELQQLISLVKPKKLLPIGGAYRHMALYQDLAEKIGYKKSDILLLDDGQEVIFEKENIRLGRTIPAKNVYVDEVSGEEVESYVLRDRQKLSEGGIVTVLVEIDTSKGEVVGKPDLIIRGFTLDDRRLLNKLYQDIRSVFRGKKGRVTNFVYMRKLIGDAVERRIFKELRRRPLVLPIVIEV